jgi:hypothetical protein
VAAVPRTKAGKARKVARTMGEFKSGDLKSSSGEKVTNPKQAVAIALNQSGQSKPPSERKEGRPRPPAGPMAAGAQNARLADAVSRRVDQGQTRGRR